MDGTQRVKGYHGTKRELAETILQVGFEKSRNEYDWLGDGVYFFQDAPARAMDWARDRFHDSAAVVGALIRLEDCMDLLDIGWSQLLHDAYDSFLDAHKKANLPLPRQSKGAHRLDREVINYLVGILAEKGVPIKCVRGAFSEGGPVFPGSALIEKAHVQIAVRDTKLIERFWMHNGG